MADNTKEVKDFREKAKLFAESFLTRLKESSYLFETEEEKKASPEKKSAKKPGRAKVRAAIEHWKSQNPEATPEQIEAHTNALLKRLGVVKSDLTKEPESKQTTPPKVTKIKNNEAPLDLKANPDKSDRLPQKLGAKKERPEDIQAASARKEFEAKQKQDLEARKVGKNKPHTSEKVKKLPHIPFYGGDKNEKATQSFKKNYKGEQDEIEDIKKNNPDLTPEQLTDLLSSLGHIKQASREQANTPSKHEKAIEKIEKRSKPGSLQRRTLGSSIKGNIVGDKIKPFIEKLFNNYKIAKEGGLENEPVVGFVEKVLGVPPLDFANPESKNQFASIVQKAHQNPTEIFPARFLQSSLRSYPENMRDKLVGILGKKGIETPDFGAIEQQIKGLPPEAQRKALNKLEIKGEHDIAPNRLANYIGDIDLPDLANLLQYFKGHEKEINATERGYREPEFVAGKGGFQGVTTGNIGKETEFPDTDFEDPEQKNYEEEMVANKLFPGAHELGNEEIPSDLNPEEVMQFATNPSHKDVDKKYFNYFKAQNALNDYFNDFDSLMQASEGHLSPEQERNMSNEFLEKIFSNPNTTNIVIKGLARQYEKDLMRKKLENEFTQHSYDKKSPAERASMLKRAYAIYTPETFKKLARAKEKEIKTALKSMLYLAKDGKIKIKDPSTVVWPGPEFKRIGDVIYSKLQPNNIINLGKDRDEKPFATFMFDKADQIHRVIADVAKTVGNRQLSGLQKRDIEAQQKGELNPSNFSLDKNFLQKKREIERGNSAQVPASQRMIGVNPAHVATKAMASASPATLSALRDFRRQNPKSGPADWDKFIAEFEHNLKTIQDQNKPTSESLFDNACINIIWEGKELTQKNLKEYFVAAMRNKTISRETLEEVLRDVNGKVTEAPEDLPWEEVQPKKLKKSKK